LEDGLPFVELVVKLTNQISKNARFAVTSSGGGLKRSVLMQYRLC